MLNERLDLTADNEAILYIKMALKNIDFALISLDHILNTQDINWDIYKDVHTYYFYYLQKTLTYAVISPMCFIIKSLTDRGLTKL